MKILSLLRSASAWKRWLSLALSLALLLLVLTPEPLWARRGGRISVGRSSGGFSRSYSPPPSRAQSWGSRPTATPRMGTRSASRGEATSANRSSVDQAALNRARTQGTAFNSRSEAERAFERDNASRFPTTFQTAPQTRPDYVPQTTTVDGRNYDVSYNPRYGGYGYMRDGTWMAYNVFRDITMLNLLMGRSGYVYGGQAAENRSGESESGGSSGFSLGSGSGLLILLLLIGGWAMIPRQRGGYRPGTAVAPPTNANVPREKRVTSDWTPYSTRFWRSLKPGSTIVLKDEQTLEDMIESGESIASGRDYQVEEAWRIRESRDVAEWQFFRIRSPRDVDATWLLVKSAGDQLSAGVYFEADGFHAGTRRELLDQNHHWVFEQPRDPSNFQLLDLQYATRLYFNLELNGEEREVEFAKLGNMEFHGNATVEPEIRNESLKDLPIGSPEAQNANRMLGTVVEYETMLPVPNSKVVFFEVGMPGADGGLVRMLQGSNIRMSDMEVLPIDPNAPANWGSDTQFPKS